ncbi:MAG: hypothetical protein KDA89_00765 [Planctomycetaceae bacterium]|nr:hypothetical protein [Planctomycetaceae bacterium]
MTNRFRVSQIATLAECNEFQYLLLGDLRDLLDDTPDETTKRWLLAVLDVLVELMPQERRLYENNGGYLTEVLDEFPGWNRQVMRLHLRKLHLDYALRELRNRIRDESSWIAAADQLGASLRDWMTLFQNLHRAESSLMMKALLLDVGGGD